MAVPAYELIVNGNSVSNVQGFTFTKGRTKISDPLRAGTGVISGRRPDLLPTITVGQDVILVIRPAGTGELGYAFAWRVADFRIIYGVTSAYDEWELDIEDTFALLGRGDVSTSWADGDPVSTAIFNVTNEYGIGLTVAIATKSLVSAQTVTNRNGLDVLSQLAITEQARFTTQSPAGPNFITLYGRGWQTQLTTYDASDDNTGTNPLVYTALDFAGLADNYASKVIVNPEGLAQQTSGSGNYSISVPSYSRNTNDASNLASFLVGVYSQQSGQPSRISLKISAQNTTTKKNNAMAICDPISQVRVKFRGLTYLAIVEGYTITGQVDDVLVSCSLSSPSFYPQFILNSAEFGVLNSNRLGY
jgi:hypothetical protein